MRSMLVENARPTADIDPSGVVLMGSKAGGSRPQVGPCSTDREKEGATPLGSNGDPAIYATKIGPRWGPAMMRRRDAFKASHISFVPYTICVQTVAPSGEIPKGLKGKSLNVSSIIYSGGNNTVMAAEG
jgi:hypothetical protein